MCWQLVQGPCLQGQGRLLVVLGGVQHLQAQLGSLVGGCQLASLGVLLVHWVCRWELGLPQAQVVVGGCLQAGQQPQVEPERRGASRMQQDSSATEGRSVGA